MSCTISVNMSLILLRCNMSVNMSLILYICEHVSNFVALQVGITLFLQKEEQCQCQFFLANRVNISHFCFSFIPIPNTLKGFFFSVKLVFQ